MVRNLSKLLSILLFQSGLLLFSCASPPLVSEEGPIWGDNDTRPIPEPEFDEPNLIWTEFERTAPDQFLELLDLDRNVRKFLGNPTQAKNVNSFDEVPNSSWFTNRQGYPATRLTSEQIETGQVITAGLDTNNVWKVFRPKVGGATPGFWIENIQGEQYLIKFDPLENPEMATAAAAMGSRFFYACGFNTPQESIIYWKPHILRIKEGATIKSPDGTKRKLTMADVEEMLTRVHKEPDGYIRSLASLNIGNVKGPFMYEGTRKGDTNDWCPHQHRRELRGLKVIASLINHYDLKDHNSMDVYVGESGQGYLKHYLMDFGSTFGSDGIYAKNSRKGYSNAFDLRDVLVTTFTAGLKTWAWEDVKEDLYPSIGHFESEQFEPEKFDPIIPNPAFEQITNQDGYWGAKIVMAFKDAELKALVSAGQLSSIAAAEYLLKTIKERQGKIGQYWFSKVNPVDFPRVAATADKITISFSDLWIDAGLGVQANHEYTVKFRGNEVIDRRAVVGNEIEFARHDLQAMKQLVSMCGEGADCGVFEILVYSTRDGRSWKMPTQFNLLLKNSVDESRIVSIGHPG